MQEQKQLKQRRKRRRLWFVQVLQTAQAEDCLKHGRCAMRTVRVPASMHMG